MLPTSLCTEQNTFLKNNRYLKITTGNYFSDMAGSALCLVSIVKAFAEEHELMEVFLRQEEDGSVVFDQKGSQVVADFRNQPEIVKTISW
jgi:hypothetical protein